MNVERFGHDMSQ